MKTSEVSIVRVGNGDVRNAVRQAVSLAGGFPEATWASARVLIKPNVVSPDPPGSGKVTDAGLVRAVTELVLERKARHVVIGEGSSVGYDFPGRQDSMHCMQAAGIVEVADELGVEVVDLNRDEQVEIRLEGALAMDSFKIARTAFEADVIICLPVLKTHMRTGITCALKNMKGVLPGDEKKRTHRVGLDRGIVDLNRAVRPHFTVVDGIVGCQGAHTGPRDRVPLGIVLAGSDPVGVDSVCAAVAGFDPKNILHIQLAGEVGLGTCEPGQIEIRGEPVDAVARPFVPFPEAARELFTGATLIERNTCTGCMGELLSLFIYLRKAGLGERLPELTIVAGSPDALPPVGKRPLVLGKCAASYRERGVFVPGCPPHGIRMTEGACEALGVDKEPVLRTIRKLHDF